MSDLFDIELGTVSIHPEVVGTPKRLLEPLGDDDYILRLDNSAMESTLACDRAGEFKLIHARTSWPSSAIIYGQAVHTGLEIFYLEGPNLSKMISEGEKVLQRIPSDPNEWRNIDALANTFSKYVEKYHPDNFSIVEINGEKCVERAFEFHLGEIELNKELAYSHDMLVVGGTSPEKVFVRKLQIVWTGVVDLIIEQQGRIRVMDHKTSSVGGPSYFEQYHLAQQFLGYTFVTSQLLQTSVDGAILNAIFGRRPTRTGKALELERQFYLYEPWKLAEWKRDTLTHISDFVDRLVSGYFPKRTLWCTGKFGTCPFLPVCQQDEETRMLLLHSDSYAPNVWDPLKKS